MTATTSDFRRSLRALQWRSVRDGGSDPALLDPRFREAGAPPVFAADAADHNVLFAPDDMPQMKKRVTGGWR